MVILSIYAVLNIGHEYFKRKEISLTKYMRYLLMWIVILGIGVPYYIYSDSQGFDDKYKYYVNMFPEEDSQKNYRVPAYITIDEDGILLDSIDWSNGGETTFYALNNPPLEENKIIPLEDDDGEIWYVELTHHVAGKVNYVNTNKND